jgi:hypothetical protein
MAIYQYVNGYPTLVGYSGDAGQALAGYGATGQVQGSPFPGISAWGGTAAAGGASGAGGTGSGTGGTTYNSVLDYARDAISRSPRLTAPSFKQAQLSDAAKSYPAALRNLAAIQSQNAFQSQVNQGIRQGNAGNAYQNALRQRDASQLAGMAQAGQAQLGVDTTAAGFLNDYQRLLAQIYGYDINQRESDLATYRAAMERGMASAGSSGGASGVVGGPGTIGGSQGSGAAGKFIGMDNAVWINPYASTNSGSDSYAWKNSNGTTFYGSAIGRANGFNSGA